MDQRKEFALRAVQENANLRGLCREYGISPKTGYKWKQRFIEEGGEGMGNRSSKPSHSPNQLSEEVTCALVRLKLAHPHWGAPKILALYQRSHPAEETPSLSSCQRVLAKTGLVKPQPVARKERGGRIHSKRKAQKPNEVWSVDFKGWWLSQDKLRCEPLTVRDEFTRYVLDIRIMESTRTEAVRECFEALFKKYGLPGAIRSDNGAPFASTKGLHGLSKLSAWWLALGINLERGRPGCPQDNGAHERLHRDIRDELQMGRRLCRAEQQASFDQWREQFNHHRPHQALGQRPPAELYQPGLTPYKGTPEYLDYSHLQTERKVLQTGRINLNGHRIPLSKALVGWNVGIKNGAEGYQIYFGSLLLGNYNSTLALFEPILMDTPNVSSALETHASPVSTFDPETGALIAAPRTPQLGETINKE